MPSKNRAKKAPKMETGVQTVEQSRTITKSPNSPETVANTEPSAKESNVPGAPVESGSKVKGSKSTSSEAGPKTKSKNPKPAEAKPKASTKDSDKSIKTEVKSEAGAEKSGPVETGAKTEASTQGEKTGNSDAKSKPQKKAKRKKKTKPASEVTAEISLSSESEQRSVSDGESHNASPSTSESKPTTVPANTSQSVSINDAQNKSKTESEVKPKIAKKRKNDNLIRTASATEQPPPEFHTPVPLTRPGSKSTGDQSNLPELESASSSAFDSQAMALLETRSAQASPPESISPPGPKKAPKPSQKHDHIREQKGKSTALDASASTTEQLAASLPTALGINYSDNASNLWSATKDTQYNSTMEPIDKLEIFDPTSLPPTETSKIVPIQSQEGVRIQRPPRSRAFHDPYGNDRTIANKHTSIAQPNIASPIARQSPKIPHDVALQVTQGNEHASAEDLHAVRQSARRDLNTASLVRSPLGNYVTSTEGNVKDRHNCLEGIEYTAPVKGVLEPRQGQAARSNVPVRAARMPALAPQNADRPARPHQSPYVDAAHYKCPEPSVSELLEEWILQNTPNHDLTPKKAATFPRRLPVGGCNAGVTPRPHSTMAALPAENVGSGRVGNPLLPQDYDEWRASGASYKGIGYQRSSMVDRSMDFLRTRLGPLRDRAAAWLGM